MFGKIWKKIKNTVKKVVRIVKEVVHRILGVVDFIASLFGIHLRKYLRLKVYILTDLKGRPVQDLRTVNAWVDATTRIFRDRMNIVIQAADVRAGQPITVVIEERAPGYALFPDCSFGSAFNDAADYYEENYDYVHTSSWNYIVDMLGYGEPIYGFVVADIAGGDKFGCAIPWLHNFALVDNNPRTTTLAHEIGHLCSLGHRTSAGNLMNPDRGDMDASLTNWQISVIRNSRYVTFFRP